MQATETKEILVEFCLSSVHRILVLGQPYTGIQWCPGHVVSALTVLTDDQRVRLEAKEQWNVKQKESVWPDPQTSKVLKLAASLSALSFSSLPSHFLLSLSLFPSSLSSLLCRASFTKMNPDKRVY